jgi:hypothetical protein
MNYNRLFLEVQNLLNYNLKTFPQFLVKQYYIN